MSQAEIETLRGFYEDLGRRDWDSVLRVTHPDIELVPPSQDPLAGVHRGHDEVRRVAQDMVEAFDEFVAEPEEFFERDDQIVAFLRLRLRPKGSSANLELKIAHVWTMRDGQAVRCEMFPEREQALEAAGLRERGPTAG